MHQSADWIAKVDGDAVFIPNRLRSWLSSQLVPDAGIYLENCKFVDYGYFGNLEVFSKAAFMTLLASIDECKASPEINWKLGIKNGKYGPMGEDLFAQTCLDLRSPAGRVKLTSICYSVLVESQYTPRRCQ